MKNSIVRIQTTVLLLVFTSFVGMNAFAATCNGKEATIEASNVSVVYGTTFNDVIVVYNVEQVHSGRGNDTICADGKKSVGTEIYGGPGDDWIHGSRARNIIDGQAGNDIIYGGAGADTLIGGSGDDELYGEKGDDEIYTNDGNDYVHGGSGDDVIWGEGGYNYLKGGSGSDYISGGDDLDSIDGGSGDDYLHGRKGDDYIDGGSGNDRIDGWDGSDILYGGSGNDEIYDGDEQNGDVDEIWGEDGDDILVYRNYHNRDPQAVINGGAGDDKCGTDLINWDLGCDDDHYVDN